MSDEGKPNGPVLAIAKLQMWATAAPTTKGWTFHTSAGPLHFHATREQLEAIGKAFLETAARMPRKSDLS